MDKNIVIIRGIGNCEWSLAKSVENSPSFLKVLTDNIRKLITRNTKKTPELDGVKHLESIR